jgi:hypothetical protein
MRHNPLHVDTIPGIFIIKLFLCLKEISLQEVRAEGKLNCSSGAMSSLGCPTKHFFFVSVRIKTNRNTKLFRLCFGLFRETIKFLFRILNRNQVEPKQNETGRNEDYQGKKDKSQRNKAKQTKPKRNKAKQIEQTDKRRKKLGNSEQNAVDAEGKIWDHILKVSDRWWGSQI